MELLLARDAFPVDRPRDEAVIQDPGDVEPLLYLEVLFEMVEQRFPGADENGVCVTDARWQNITDS